MLCRDETQRFTVFGKDSSMSRATVSMYLYKLPMLQTYINFARYMHALGARIIILRHVAEHAASLMKNTHVLCHSYLKQE